MDEPPYFEYPGLSDVGHPLGTYWGYVADGLFPRPRKLLTILRAKI